MQIDGSCHCGRIAYRAEIDPDTVYVCHCSDCQAISGSPYRWAVSVPAEKFELLRGEPKAYEKTGESGRKNHQMFCPDCASPIYSVTPGTEPAVYRLRLGTARQRNLLKPTAQYWCRSAQDWAISLPGSHCVERQ
jgi:hypothetical protein